MQATGEPALLMGISVLFSIWDALNSSRFGFADFTVLVIILPNIFFAFEPWILLRTHNILVGKTVDSQDGGS